MPTDDTQTPDPLHEALERWDEWMDDPNGSYGHDDYRVEAGALVVAIRAALRVTDTPAPDRILATPTEASHD